MIGLSPYNVDHTLHYRQGTYDKYARSKCGVAAAATRSADPWDVGDPIRRAEVWSLNKIGALDVLSFEAPADTAYGRIRIRLERAGTPTGGNDLLIAAQAVALGYTLVTDNESELARVEGLPRENRLRGN